MLRRRMLRTLFFLTALLMGLAVAALWSLKGVFSELHHINTDAADAVVQANRLNADISTIEVELHRLRGGRTHHLDTLIGAVESMHEVAETIARHYTVREPEIAPVHERLM